MVVLVLYELRNSLIIILSYLRIYSFALASNDNQPPFAAWFSLKINLDPAYFFLYQYLDATDEVALIDELMAWSPPPLWVALLFKSTKVLLL